jgi:hypothetical protein
VGRAGIAHGVTPLRQKERRSSVDRTTTLDSGFPGRLGGAFGLAFRPFD